MAFQTMSHTFITENFKWLLFFTLLLLLTQLQMSLSPMPLLPSLPRLPCGQHHTVACVHGLCVYVLWRIPSPSLSQPPLSPPLWQLSHGFMPVSTLLVCLFRSLDSTYKWALSFTNCLISLSRIISRSIHAVAKGKRSFFFIAEKCSTV